jgi:hypothetical protein
LIENAPGTLPGISEILERSSVFGLVPKFWSTIGPINMLSFCVEIRKGEPVHTLALLGEMSGSRFLLYELPVLVIARRRDAVVS